MSTVEEVARDALAALASDAGHLLAARWINERFAEVAGISRLRALREIGELRATAPISAGTVSIAADSAIVTGDATAQAAWANIGLVGRFLRFGTDQELYYIVAQYADSLRLRGARADGAVVAGGYDIIQRFHRLDPRARFLGAFVCNWQVLRAVDATSLDYVQPSRVWTSSLPQAWSEAPADTDGCKRIELFPVSSAAVLVRYAFWPAPRDYGLRDSLPPFVDVLKLREGVMIDLMRYEMAKAARAGKIEEAALWRNEYRTQETRWQEHLRDMRAADQSADDVEVIMLSGTTNTPVDIRTAYDEVISRLGTG